jgi:hypothetical protein
MGEGWPLAPCEYLCTYTNFIQIQNDLNRFFQFEKKP